MQSGIYANFLRSAFPLIPLHAILKASSVAPVRRSLPFGCCSRPPAAGPCWGVVQPVGHLTVNEDGEGSNPSAPANFSLDCSPFQRCLMNLPVSSSEIAWRNSACVFMTIGPYHATGSSIGLPDTSRNRMPSSPACTTISSPRSNNTSE